MKKIIKGIMAIVGLCVTADNVYSQDARILIGLDGPAYGVKILSKFPNGTGGFARGYSIANQDNSETYIQLGTFGNYFGGISNLTYSYIGREYNNTYMVFRPNGDIGIGTINPQEKLSVNGKIRAHEIKVETSNWPDYVFKTDYKLPTLPETERFIKENGHLPEVPKASEVEADGVSLGEMNKILLKKIEELTLQVIELNKKVDRQDERIKLK
ncbi:hypothetical protein [Sphingobacterium siyangense]|uniref:hypothetical protein n=1 Tax=Sphingobacterium siyangense TaxID=459529 RepID=UPI0019661599|nr:hypothetical protein [Sphingobacterium siyangense]QRY57131.1 hypothetical protein JVX97_24570 [Sphingobacterium siyangense]